MKKMMTRRRTMKKIRKMKKMMTRRRTMGKMMMAVAFSGRTHTGRSLVKLN